MSAYSIPYEPSAAARNPAWWQSHDYDSAAFSNITSCAGGPALRCATQRSAGGSPSRTRQPCGRLAKPPPRSLLVVPVRDGEIFGGVTAALGLAGEIGARVSVLLRDVSGDPGTGGCGGL